MFLPAAKANVYDYSTHQPLAIRWAARVKAGKRIDEFISLTDMAPTFLEAANLKPPLMMTGRSFLGLLTGALPRSATESSLNASGTTTAARAMGAIRCGRSARETSVHSQSAA